MQRVALASCFSAKRGAYARLSTRMFLHLVLSLSKGGAGTRRSHSTRRPFPVAMDEV